MSDCEICGEPMPPGEEMFKFHGYSGNCLKPPLQRCTHRWTFWVNGSESIGIMRCMACGEQHRYEPLASADTAEQGEAK